VSLRLGRPSGADDSDRLLGSFCVDDQHEAGLNRADADETILIVAMLSVIDFEVVVIAGEQLLRLIE